MNTLERHPMILIVIGIMGISLSSIFVKYAQSPSVVTAAYRLLWTIILMTPAVICSKKYRQELLETSPKLVLLCILSGIFLALHFTLWFESLNHTSVASSTTIVCTEVIWVALGWRLFLKGRLSGKACGAIAVTLAGSMLIAFSDSSGQGARATASTTVYTYLVYGACAVTLVLMTLAQGLSLTGYGSSGIVVGFLLAVFSTILGHSIFSWCLKFLSPAFVSASKLCEPAVAAVFAAFLFHEIPKPLQILGGLVIIAGVIAYSRVEQGQEKE